MNSNDGSKVGTKPNKIWHNVTGSSASMAFILNSNAILIPLVADYGLECFEGYAASASRL